MIKGLNDIKPAPGGGAKARVISGRGASARRGGKAGKGNKGQKARTGYAKKATFEGGQMPIQRRVPKRGFTNKWRIPFEIVNLDDFKKVQNFEGPIDPEIMLEYRLIRKKDLPVKVLGRGGVDRSFEIHAHAFSESAKSAIESAGGKVVIIS